MRALSEYMREARLRDLRENIPPGKKLCSLCKQKHIEMKYKHCYKCMKLLKYNDEAAQKNNQKNKNTALQSLP